MQRSLVERASKVAATGLLTWGLLGTVSTARLYAEPEQPPAATPATEPASAAAAGTAAPSAKPATGRDIADTLTSDGRFETLTQALRTAGMVSLLKAKGPYTLFAPTDEAWKKLPSGMLDGLIAQPAQLKAILAYHIIRGRVDNVGLHKLRNALTMGGIVNIDYTSGVKINSAVVTGADLGCRNGIVHAIDKVLLPSDRKKPGAAKPASARKPARARGPAASGAPPAPAP
jgi:uncharacterized surface protein with fasciclin (FAS1) repeats